MTRALVVFALCTVTAAMEGRRVHGAPLQATRMGVRGKVIVEPGRTPLPGAVVRLTDHAGATRLDVTDERGQFGFSDLTAGAYSVSAEKATFVAPGVGGQATSTDLFIDGRTVVTDVQLALAKGGAITGVLRDLAGVPAPDVRVSLSGTLTAQTTSDDQGVYRFFGLPQGSYKVSATPRVGPQRQFASRSTADNDTVIAELRRIHDAGLAVELATTRSAPAFRTGADAGQPNSPVVPLSWAPVYYPGTPDPSQAVALQVASAQELTNIDFQLVLAGTTRIRGIVTHSDGRPGSGARVLGEVVGVRSGLPPLAAVAEADGSFNLSSVLPGQYRLTAITRDDPKSGQRGQSSSAPAEWATTDVTVTGGVNAVTLSLRPALKLSGRLEIDSARSPATWSGLTVVLTPTAEQLMTRPIQSMVGFDGAFEVVGILPGVYTISIGDPPLGYALRSAKSGDRELLDAPLVFEEHDLENLLLVLSDKRSSVTGRVVADTAAQRSDYAVVVFPVDRNLWRTPRRLAMSHVTSDGSYAVNDLPPGEYLLAVAHADALRDLWPSVDYLSILSASAIALTLGDGQHLVRDVRVLSRFQP